MPFAGMERSRIDHTGVVHILRRTGIDGASTATGPCVVIDTFRAFTTAAVLFSRDIDRLILAEGVAEAREIGRGLGAILCGEDRGIRPEGFDLGNSPSEALTRPGLVGRTVVMRTTAGTRSVIAARTSGATPVLAASLVVASATANALVDEPSVTIVSAGLHGTEPSLEDDRTGDVIAAVLAGSPDVAATTASAVRAVAESDRAHVLRTAPWSHPDDVTIALDVDRFDFTMEAVSTPDGRVELRRRT